MIAVAKERGQRSIQYRLIHKTVSINVERDREGEGGREEGERERETFLFRGIYPFDANVVRTDEFLLRLPTAAEAETTPSALFCELPRVSVKMEKLPDKNRLQREALLLISPENTSGVKRKNIKEPARREIKEFEQRKGISTSAGVKGRRLLLLIAMIGVVQVNVTQTSKKMKAKRKEGNT